MGESQRLIESRRSEGSALIEFLGMALALACRYLSTDAHMQFISPVRLYDEVDTNDFIQHNVQCSTKYENKPKSTNTAEQAVDGVGRAVHVEINY